MSKLTIEELATFCKSKGFVYQDSEIYGGLSGFWDLGPVGVELFNNLKVDWWKHFVQSKENMVGMHGSVISNPKVWKASGHLENFGDLVLACSKCNNKLRADHFLEDTLDINVEGKKSDEINDIITKNKLSCPNCKGSFKELTNFNLLFKTSVGAEESKGSIAYLRGETAQGMFTNFKLITETARMKIPFGIAQIGTCFRNEIAPRDFIFRSREFTIAEFEFFKHPDEKKCEMLEEKHLDMEFMLLSSEVQEKDKKDLKKSTIRELVKKEKLDEWHAYWLAEQISWLYSIGLKKNNLKIREHTKKELSHYSSATFDIDYLFPFGSKEIAGNANRGQYDLKQHIQESKEKLEVFDEATKQKIIPSVIEPTFGIERTFLSIITEAYEDDKERGNIVLKFNNNIAPVKVAVFPLVNKIKKEGKEVFDSLKEFFTCQFDSSGSVGRRYARADEIGIPYCITFDFESLEDKSVTIRNRDDTQQVRVPVEGLKDTISKLLNKELEFEKAGKLIK
ncbi:glycine--tRNA ligase [Candidatus Woesearchaeota archaeon]|nr:glycine--tRNA ligase [Candidatus Woesearchaeota archaeon]